MKKYIPYIEKHNLPPNIQSGVVNIDYIKQIYEVNNTKFNFKTVNRAFDKDIVYYDKSNVLYVEQILQRKNIIGILQITSITTYGMNKKGSFYYKFIPNDRKKYPEFYVPFNLKSKLNKTYKLKSKNIYCIINFNKWLIHSDKPYGSITKIIGTVGDINVEYNVILYKYNLYKSNKINKLLIDNVNNVNQINQINNIISIDPPGCKDIDDALHYKHIGQINNNYEIGIHIADVSKFVKPLSEIDIEARKRLVTIYSPNKIFNMLPEQLSNNLCSLQENKIRNVVSLLIQFNDSDDIVDYKFVKQQIINNKALTYEQADKLINSNKYNLNKLMDKANIIQQKFNINCNNLDKNSHKLVEVYMILANMLAAEYLINKNKNILIRIHKKNNSFNINQNIDKQLKKHLYIKNMNKAEYTIYKPNINIFHHGLNVKCYTHFTSPIRRYADIIVHRMLFDNLLMVNNDLNTFITDMNNITTKIKKAKLDLNYLTLINQLNNSEKIVDCFITDVSLHKLTVFIGCYNLSIRFRLFDKKLDNIINYKLNEEKNMLTILDNNNNIKQYRLLDKITIKIIPYLNNEIFYNKLKIRICH